MVASASALGEEPRSAVLVGEGTAPELKASATRVAFGGVRLTESGQRSLVLSNRGSAPLELARLSIDGEASRDFALAAEDCPTETALEPGDESPMAFVDRADGALYVSKNSGRDRTTVAAPAPAPARASVA